MSVLEQARTAVFGETWALPIAVAMLIGAAAALELTVPDAWREFGGVFLLAGGVVVLVALVDRGR